MPHKQKHNTFEYAVFKNTILGRADRRKKGFTGGNVSENKKLILGDVGKSSRSLVKTVPVKPDYWDGPWPYMSHEDSLRLKRILATSKGASDGWTFKDMDS